MAALAADTGATPFNTAGGFASGLRTAHFQPVMCTSLAARNASATCPADYRLLYAEKKRLSMAGFSRHFAGIY